MQSVACLQESDEAAETDAFWSHTRRAVTHMEMGLLDHLPLNIEISLVSGAV